MNSSQDILFEKILELYMKDKLVLWAGAGLSMEAGYPSGSQLAELLWQRLTEDEKLGLSKDLLKVSDFYVHRNDKGRDELIMLLKEIFKKKDQKSESHELIEKMAFFRTIITTNYDELFEEHIAGIQVIKSAKSLTRTKSNSRKLIKIHGDLKSPKKLILSQTDYSKLYNINHQDPFWGKINVELAEKGVVFIGYGLNDLNIRGLIDFLQRKLKKYKHPKYLIAPNLSNSEVAKLGSYEIQYLDSTGLDFLRKLYKVWKEKGFRHFADTEVSADVLLNSLKKEGVPLEIGIHPTGSRLLKFKPMAGKAIAFSFDTQDVELEKKIDEWKNGFGPDNLSIPKESIINAELKIGDFVIGDKSTIPDFQLFRNGDIIEGVRILIKESNIEFENLKIRKHKYGHNGFKITVYDEHATFTIIIPDLKTSGFSYTGTFRIKSPCKSISTLLKWHDAVLSLANGESFRIFSKNLPNGFKDASLGESFDAKEFEKNRLIFKVLRNIEEKFGIRFFEIHEKDVFDNNTLKELQKFLDLFRTNRITPDYSKGLPIRSISNDPDSDLIPLIKEAKEEGYLVFNIEKNEINILGQSIDLGKAQLFIDNPILENSPSGQGDLVVKSSNNNYILFYEAFGLPKMKEGIRQKN